MKQALKNFTKGFLAVAALALVVAGAGVGTETAFAVDCNTSGGINAGVECATPQQSKRQLVGDGGIFQTVVNILLFVVGAVAVIMLIIGGIRYVISGGDQGAVTSAKNTILYAIVGIVVAFLAYALVNFVITQLNTSAPAAGGVITSQL
ncbi:hypothetical protein CYG49_02995 [Candidatus Saccharibacteria bacterium]|nr:MAG: hypothetical protein CYG49_02995 [Candidatus Saccharibacteria bacterium]